MWFAKDNPFEIFHFWALVIFVLATVGFVTVLIYLFYSKDKPRKPISSLFAFITLLLLLLIEAFVVALPQEHSVNTVYSTISSQLSYAPLRNP